MVFPPPVAPLPHLARLPNLVGAPVVGSPHSFRGVESSSPATVVNITEWPCSSTCIARTATMAALAHSDAPPSLLTVFTSAPGPHPAVDAARAATGWTVMQTSEPLVSDLRQTWYAAREASNLGEDGLLVVDRTGSVRAMVPASPQGVEAAHRHIAQLVTADPG